MLLLKLILTNQSYNYFKMLNITRKISNFSLLSNQPTYLNLLNQFNILSKKNNFYFSQPKLHQPKQHKSQFKFNVLTQNQFYQSIPHIANVFSKVQPALGLNLKDKDIRIFLEIIAPIALKRGISLACKNQQGIIVGSTLMFDTYDEKDIDQSKLNPKIWPSLFRLLEAVSLEFYTKNNIMSKPGVYAHSFMTSVYEEYQNYGISSLIYKQQHNHCKKLGYKYLIREATHPKARHNLLKLGTYKELKYLAFKDFELNGEKPLKNSQHGAAFLVNDLTIQK